MTAILRNRHVAWLAVMICAGSIAQQGRWAHVTPNSLTANISAARLPESQRKSIERRIVSVLKAHDWGCDNNEVAELLRSLSYWRMPLKSNAKIVSATTRKGCARGVELWWLFDVDDAAVYLGELNGSPGILHSTSEEHSDVVTQGRHVGDRVGLVYYQFDGQQYREIDEAVAISDGNGGWKVIPDRPKEDSRVQTKEKH